MASFDQKRLVLIYIWILTKGVYVDYKHLTSNNSSASNPNNNNNSKIIACICVMHISIHLTLIIAIICYL